MRRDDAAPRVVHHALIWLCCLVLTYPLLWLVASSVKDDTEIFSSSGLLPRSWDLGNYLEGWAGSGTSFGVFFANSLFVAAATVVGNVASCSLAAFAFARLEFPLRRLWFGVMLVTMMLPVHVTLVPQYTLFHRLGLVNTFYPLFLPHFFAVDGFFVFLMVQFIRGIPRELDEAARLDGCNPGQVFIHVVLPLLRPALVTTAIFSFIWSYNNFFAQLVYLSDAATFTVPLGLRQFLDAAGQSSWGPLFAMSVLSLLPPFALFLFFQRWIIEGIATTGGKV